MAHTRYSYKIDLSNLNTSHSLAVLSVPPASRVLDLGAADGSVACALKERHCTVWGVERDERAAEDAGRVCDRVVVGDLESATVWEILADETFDVVLALDVLEHLRDPGATLRRAASHMKPNGIAIVSVPNIAHGAVRLNLLNGRFDYTDLGLVDRTHLRFFDRRSAEALMTDAGLIVAEHLRVTRELEDTEIPIQRAGASAELLARLAADPDARTYQFVFVGRRTEDTSSPLGGGMLAERLLAENEDIRARVAQLEQDAKSLEADRANIDSQQSSHLRSELDLRLQEAHHHRLEMRHCKADLLVRQAYIDDLRAEAQAKDSVLHELGLQVCALEARENALTMELDRLRIYSNSAGFRLLNGLIARLRRVPFLFAPIRAIVRMIGKSRPLPKNRAEP